MEEVDCNFKLKKVQNNKRKEESPLDLNHLLELAKLRVILYFYIHLRTLLHDS